MKKHKQKSVAQHNNRLTTEKTVTAITTDTGQLATERERLNKNSAANCVKIIIIQTQKQECKLEYKL